MQPEELKRISQAYADSQGFKLQPDKGILDMILNGLLNNEKKHGFRYCPCRRITGDRDKDKINICPCIYHKDEIKQDGHCKCQLFLRK